MRKKDLDMFKRKLMGKTPKSLVAETTGGEKEIAKLEEASRQINEKILKITRLYNDLNDSVIKNKMTLAIVNGFVSLDEYTLARKVLQASLIELQKLNNTKADLQDLNNKIKEILARFKASKAMEDSMLGIESYLNSVQAQGFSANESIESNFSYELQDLNKTSKRLLHTVNALVDLKTGKI